MSEVKNVEAARDTQHGMLPQLSRNQGFIKMSGVDDTHGVSDSLYGVNDANSGDSTVNGSRERNLNTN